MITNLTGLTKVFEEALFDEKLDEKTVHQLISEHRNRIKNALEGNESYKLALPTGQVIKISPKGKKAKAT
jgi:hypothetical protein